MSVVTIEPGVGGGRERTARSSSSGALGAEGLDAEGLGAEGLDPHGTGSRHPAVRARAARQRTGAVPAPVERTARPAPPALRLVPPREAVGAAAGAGAVGTIRPAGWRLTRRGRAVLLGLVVALCAALAVGLGAARLGAAGPSGPAVPARTTVVTVDAGDTLWSIASDTAPGADLRAVVDRITALNHLSGGRIEPGQRLVVPVG